MTQRPRTSSLSRKTRSLGSSEKAASGEGPLNVRSYGNGITDAVRKHVRIGCTRKLGKFAAVIDNVTARFSEVPSPLRVVDKACRIKIGSSELPQVSTEKAAPTMEAAFDRALAAAVREVVRSIETAGYVNPKSRGRSRRAAAPAAEAPLAAPAGDPDAGSLIGRRVGRSSAKLAGAAARPEKRRRNAAVDTSAAKTSASKRKVGARASARRNTKLNAAGMTSALEDSQAQPSRKSTRKSSGRSKRDSNLKRRETRRVAAPESRANRATARKRSPKGKRRR